MTGSTTVSHHVYAVVEVDRTTLDFVGHSTEIITYSQVDIVTFQERPSSFRKRRCQVQHGKGRHTDPNVSASSPNTEQTSAEIVWCEYVLINCGSDAKAAAQESKRQVTGIAGVALGHKVLASGYDENTCIERGLSTSKVCHSYAIIHDFVTVAPMHRDEKALTSVGCNPWVCIPKRLFQVWHMLFWLAVSGKLYLR